MGKAKRFNAYDGVVKQKRLEVQSYGAQRQRLSINSSFRGLPLEPPIAVSTGSSSSGDGTGTFCSASLSADQTANIAATDHIEFDTLDEDGGITLQTGAGQLDGIFELGAGKKYYLTGAVRPEFSGATGQLVMAWYDITNTAELGKRAIYEAQTHASNNANQPKAEIVITPPANITVEFRIIAVTALTALATEYSQATIFEIALGGSSSGGGSGGGGSITFPITPDINDHGNVGTTTEDLDLSATTGHIHKITLTGNPTLTFSNPPSSGTQMEFEIEFVQDATGNRTVTFPASVVEGVSISAVASATTIITCRTNDGGTTYHAIPALRGTINLSGGTNFASITLNNLGSTAINTSLISDTDATDDLGTAALAWKTIYVDSINNLAATTVSSPTFTIASATINLGDAQGDIINILADNVLPALDDTSILGSTAKVFNTVWANLITSDVAVGITAATFNVNSATINLGDAQGDHINILCDTVWPALDDTTILGKTGKVFNTVWANLITSDVAVGITAATFNVNSATINLGDAQTDHINILTDTVWPALDDTTILGKTGKQFNTIWTKILTSDTTLNVTSSTFTINSATINIGDAVGDNINVLGQVATNIVMEEITIPAASPANTGRFYAKVSGAVSVPFWMDEAGTESNLLSGAEVPIWTEDHDANGFVFIMDADGDTSIEASTDDVINMKTGGSSRLTIANTGVTLATPLTSTSTLQIDSTSVFNGTITANAKILSSGGTIDIGDSTTGNFNSLYLDNTLFCSNLKVWTGDSDINVFNDLDMQAGDTIDYADTATTAGTGSGGTLPANVEDYIIIKVNGTSRRVAFYPA